MLLLPLLLLLLLPLLLRVFIRPLHPRQSRAAPQASKLS
jgi:hypothetical protein